MRQTVRHHERNRVARSKARTQVKQAVADIGAGDKAAAEQSVRDAMRALDKAAEKGILKRNNAARRKSRLMKKLNQLKPAP